MTESLGENDVEQSHALRLTEIVDTALRLLNVVGLEKLSVRGVAQELGMHPPGLYWYIESKQELIDRMAAGILSEGYLQLQPPGVGESWSAWLVGVAMHVRATLLRYRDGARVVASAYPFQMNGIRPWIEMMLAVLEEAGFTQEQAMSGALTVLHYTTGIVLNEQLSPVVPQESPMPPVQVSLHTKRMATSSHCRDVAAFRERQFALGLELIVAGMREWEREAL